MVPMLHNLYFNSIVLLVFFEFFLDLIKSSILCFFLRFSQPDSNFLDRFIEDMASIFEHNCSRRLDEKIKRTKFRDRPATRYSSL